MIADLGFAALVVALVASLYSIMFFAMGTSTSNARMLQSAQNGIYAVFTNPVGMDDDQVRNGNAMIIDPHGDIVAECTALGDDLVVATCFPELMECSLGKKFVKARRPDLYDQLVAAGDAPAQTTVSWM